MAEFDLNNRVLDDSILDEDEQENRDEVLRALTRRNFEHKRLLARRKKLWASLMGKPVIFGVNVGVVIKSAAGPKDDETHEFVTVAHDFSQKTAQGRIRWARESNAGLDSVNPFDAESTPAPNDLPFRSTQARENPNVREREVAYYTKQLKLAVAFAAQWADHRTRELEVQKQQAKLAAELRGED